MANRYWAAGVTGNWNSTSSWSSTADGLTVPASVPTTTDAVFFNAASGAVTATLDISPTIQTLTCTGFTGTLDFSTRVIFLNSTGTVFVGSTTMTVASAGTPSINLTNATTTATRTINAGAVTEANSISFAISAGSGTAVVTITGGGAVRDLSFTGYTGSHNATSYTMYGSLTLGTGMTVSAGSTTTFAATSGTNTITTNNVVYDKNITFNGVGGTWRLTGALTSGATRTTTLTNGTLNLNGFTFTTGIFSSNNSNVRILDFGTGGGIYLTAAGNNSIYSATDSTNLNILGDRNVFVTGVGTGGNIRSILGGAITSGGTAANALNFNISAGDDTIFFGTANRVFNNIQFNSGFTGSIGTNSAPFIYGNLYLSSGMSVAAGTNSWVFKATSGPFTIATNNVTINNPITFDGVGGTWEFIGSLTLNSTSALTLTNGTLNIGSNVLTIGAFNSNNANTRSLSIGGLGGIVITGRNTNVIDVSDSTGLSYTGGSIQLAANGIVGETRSVLGASTGGTESNALNILVYGGVDIIDFGNTNRVIGDLFFLEFNGSTAANTNFTSYGYLYLYGGDPGITNGMTVTGGNVVWTFAASSGTQAINTNGVVINNSVTLDGANTIWEVSNVLNVTGTLTLANGTLKLPAGVGSTVGSFVTTGTSQKYLQSTTSGVQATINDTSGTNTATYLTIQDINAAGGATWIAFYDQGNVNAGNNTGWIFEGHDVGFGTGSGGTCFGFGFRI